MRMSSKKSQCTCKDMKISKEKIKSIFSPTWVLIDVLLLSIFLYYYSVQYNFPILLMFGMFFLIVLVVFPLLTAKLWEMWNCKNRYHKLIAAIIVIIFFLVAFYNSLLRAGLIGK